jgi:hypothetical protein
VTGRRLNTICGSWVAVPYAEEYGWTTRLVCVREPHDDDQHRGRLGHTWRDGEVPALLPGREDK